MYSKMTLILGTAILITGLGLSAPTYAREGKTDQMSMSEMKKMMIRMNQMMDRCDKMMGSHRMHRGMMQGKKS